MKKPFQYLTYMGLILGLNNPLQARDTSGDFVIMTALNTTGPAKPVAAWTRFCELYDEKCEVTTAEPAFTTLTPQIWQTITSVNLEVNRMVKPRIDMDNWGVLDKWDLAENGYGDCEDYQLLKRKKLVEQGLPNRALRMTVVLDEKAEGHAVLMVRTDRGDYILDNKTNAVLPWQRTPYTYIKREGQDNMNWVSLGHTSAPFATANP